MKYNVVIHIFPAGYTVATLIDMIRCEAAKVTTSRLQQRFMVVSSLKQFHGGGWNWKQLGTISPVKCIPDTSPLIYSGK